MKLIHVALWSEAKPLVDFLQLKQYETKPFKVFKSKDYILVVSGIGRKNTHSALAYIFKHYAISHAYNIGMAGCNDTSLAIGTLCECSKETNKADSHMKLITCDTPCTTNDPHNTSLALFDMEGEYFVEFCSQYLHKKNISIHKIVSDYLDDTVLKKQIIYELVHKNLKIWYNSICKQ